MGLLVFLLLSALIAMGPVIVLRGAATWWLLRDMGRGESALSRLDLAFNGVVRSGLAAPIVWFLLARVNQALEGSPWMQVIVFGVPYFGVCLAFDWWEVRETYNSTYRAGQYHILLWLWTANIFNCAWTMLLLRCLLTLVPFDADFGSSPER